MPVLDRSVCNLGKWLCYGFIFFFYAYLVLLVTLAILFMQISSEDAFWKDKLDISMLISISLQWETEAEELTWCFHDPSVCFQTEVVTLNAEGKKRGNAHAQVYGCWQNHMWKLFVLSWCLIPSNSAQCSPLSWIVANMSGCFQRCLLWKPVW